MVRNERRLSTTEHKDMKQKTTKRRSLEDCVVVAKTDTFVCFHQKKKKEELLKKVYFGDRHRKYIDSIPVSGPYLYLFYLLYTSVYHHEKVSS